MVRGLPSLRASSPYSYGPPPHVLLKAILPLTAIVKSTV